MSAHSTEATTIPTPPARPAAERGASWFGQPRGLVILFLTEMWEKFSFYGMRTLQIYYMIKQLQFSQADASLIYGLYAGGVYLTPIFGGYAADRWLGRRRAIIAGGLLMALGHFTLASESLFFPALVLIALGNGLFLPNLPSQVGDLYAADDPRRGGAYNIYYVGVNLGALLAPLVCGTLGELYGWHVGFGAAGIGMCLGLAIYILGGKHLPADRPRAAQAQPARPAEAVPSAPQGRGAFLPLLLVALTVIVFRSAYEQSGNTLAVWVDGGVDLQVFGFAVPVTWVQALNPLFVFLFTPLVVGLWRRAAGRGREPAPLTKMAIGAAGVGLSYLLLALVAGSSGGQPVHGLWLLLFFMLYTLGELYILPVGLGLFARLAPVGMGATVIAAWFLASFGGNLLSGVVGRGYAWLGAGGFFLALAGIAGCAAAALLALRPLLKGGGAPR
ncbi:peptide MFS transporter [Roseateles violae]|uniref:Peptide MFS transporter n=1 Tax=Roseateles violae TaxID=3058042 RepID=A0ABT8DLZ9_9BURK|nr:peptide MFS transporter [Pelomonas sp. PFR6]MDN3919132.1 peptide MFS transporter [Pelomonas sp. PFR6]